jgi:4-amino-4-deoxy-L-arabinose transferase-like glycosyltransferase
LKKPGPSKRASPSRNASLAQVASLPAGLNLFDGALVAMLLTLALFIMARSGFRRGMELMPWPDGLEYAAAAVNLDRGMGPVLHFGGYSYPSRYTEGYPLILAAAFPILGHHVELLCLVTAVMGLVAIAALYILTFAMFGRASAFAACLLLTLSPVFITYSTLVLSDVPTMTVTILTALMLYRASEAEDASSSRWIVWAALGGLFAGFTVMIRPTNATMLLGIVAAMFIVRSRRRLGELLPVAIAFGLAFAIFPIWQAWTNYRYLGGLTDSGYVFWVPEVYGSFAKTFNPRFLFGATMPGNPYGNLLSYVLTLTGLDGMLGDPGDPRYLMYPFAAAVFAVIGIFIARRSSSRSVLRVMWFGIAFLVVLVVLYLFYFFTEIAFILPATFILFVAAGYGIVAGNRAMLDAYARVRKTSRDSAIIAGVVALDLMLAISMVAETVGRATATPAQSKMVPTLLAISPQLQPDALVISNISLEFLELYLAKPKTELIGLNAFDPGGQYTDYHLARLYVKKAGGTTGPVPPVLFGGPHLDDAEAKRLIDAMRGGRPAYLLVTRPEREDYADLLKDELTQLNASFNLDSIAQSDLIDLYRLTPR